MLYIHTVYMYTGTFFSFKVDIIGHIDNFAEDWKTKIASHYNLPERYQYGDGNNMGQPDPDYIQKRASVNLTHGHLFHREVSQLIAWICMYVCMHVLNVCVCVSNLYINSCMYVCMHACMHACVINLNEFNCTCMCIYI